MQERASVDISLMKTIRIAEENLEEEFHRRITNQQKATKNYLVSTLSQEVVEEKEGNLGIRGAKK